MREFIEIIFEYSIVEKNSVDSDEIKIGQKKIIEATRFRNWYGVVDHDGTNETNSYYSGFSNAFNKLQCFTNAS